MMNGNPLGMLMQMMNTAAANPQQAIQQIMSSNPDFAKAIQGQNPQQLAMKMMKKRGIDPNMLGQFLKR